MSVRFREVSLYIITDGEGFRIQLNTMVSITFPYTRQAQLYETVYTERFDQSFLKDLSGYKKCVKVFNIKNGG